MALSNFSSFIILVGNEGIGPPTSACKTDVIPFHQSPLRQEVEPTFHDLFQFTCFLSCPMIHGSAIDEVVGTDLVASSASINLFTFGVSTLSVTIGSYLLRNTAFEKSACLAAIRMLIPTIDEHRGSRRCMHHSDSRIGLVLVLASRPVSPLGLDFDVSFI